MTTGQIAIGTPSYTFKSKMQLAGIGSASGKTLGGSTINITNQQKSTAVAGTGLGTEGFNSLNKAKEGGHALSQRGMILNDSVKENLNNLDLSSVQPYKNSADYYTATGAPQPSATKRLVSREDRFSFLRLGISAQSKISVPFLACFQK